MDHTTADITCLAMGGNLRELFVFAKRLVAAGQRPVLADQIPLGLEIIGQLALNIVVINTPTVNTLHCVKESSRQLLSRYSNLRLVYDCLAESQEWSEIDGSRAIYYFERGASPARIRSVIDVAAFSDGLVGAVFRIDLIDFLQLVIMKRESRALAVRGIEGSGRIIIKEGNIVDATCGEVRGREALLKVLGQEQGQFVEVDLPESTERTIHDASQSLLLDSLRLRDERHRLRGSNDGNAITCALAATAPGEANDVDAMFASIDMESKDKL